MVWEMWELWEMWETVTNLEFAGANSTLNRENMEISVQLWILSGLIWVLAWKVWKYVIITLLLNVLPLKADMYAW